MNVCVLVFVCVCMCMYVRACVGVNVRVILYVYNYVCVRFYGSPNFQDLNCFTFPTRGNLNDYGILPGLEFVLVPILLRHNWVVVYCVSRCRCCMGPSPALYIFSCSSVSKKIIVVKNAKRLATTMSNL